MDYPPLLLVGAELEAVEAAVAEARAQADEVWVANVNAPGQVVVSGEISAVERLAKAAPAIGGKVIRVPVGGAFHTPLMAPAEAELGQALMLSRFAQRHRPVVANVDAKPYVYGHVWPALALRQLTSPVRWSESVSVMAQSLGCTTLLELGPGRSLVGMARRIAPAIPAASVSHPDALADMVDR